MRTTFLIILALITAALLAAQPRTLDIYWIDVEGGAATLIVSPTGESLLVDTGFPGQEDRDQQRILAAAQEAGVSRINYLVTTHYHVDHVGGISAFANLMPVDQFIDHGESVEASGRGGQTFTNYTDLVGGKRRIVEPGEKIQLGGVDDITVVSASGTVIGEAINGGSANALCQGAEQKPEDTTENAQSVGFLLSYGSFTFLDVGDLTWDREMQLACPVNKVGQVSLFQATHHGFSNGQSGAPALIWSLNPQVVVVNNGARKGFSNEGYETLAQIPDVEAIWQGHTGERNDADHNTDENRIANPAGGEADQGHWIKASVSADGTFTITNGRNNYSESYSAR